MNTMKKTNELMVFAYLQLGQLRVIKDGNNNVWFCLKDVCDLLGLDNTSRVKQRLYERGVTTSKVPTCNQFGAEVMTPMTFISEGNLYRCIFQSRKDEAERFQDWVTDEVLPQIRKTGGYISVAPEDDEKMILCKAIGIFKRTVDEQRAQIEAQKPKVEFADAITSSDDSILIRDLAKLITQNGVNIGQGRLFYWLRLHGYLFQNETRPIQKWVEKGLFSTNVSLVYTHHGKKEKITTKVTGKGQEYFVQGFLSGRFSAVFK